MDIESDAAFMSLQGQQKNLNHVKFYQRYVTNKEGKNGRHEDFIMIISPGQSKSEVHRKVRDEDKREYREQWAQYQEGVDQRQTGTPLEMLPGIPVGMSRACNAQYVYTIEQMAQLSDIGVQNIGMGAMDLREKCKAWIADKSRIEVKMQEELRAKDEEIAELRKRLDEIEKRAPIEKSPAKQRGRARKNPVLPAH